MPSTAKCPTPSPQNTPPISRRWPALSTPSSAPKSHSTTPSPSPAAARSGSAWSPPHGCLLIALDLDDRRLEIARACGADLCSNPGKVDAVAAVHQLTDGYGCDVYIEATGHPTAVEQGLHMICKLGTFVEFSVMREPVTVDWTIIGDTKELDVRGAHLSPHCYPIAIDMLAKGLLPMDQIITHRLPLQDFQRGIDLVAAGNASIKVTLAP